MASPGDVPAGANEHCPGADSEEAGHASACAGCPNQSACQDAPKGPDPDAFAIARRLAGVRHVVLVLSGKGGVGKSTVSSQLAFGLASLGLEVGLMDVDVCGPSVPRMLGLEGEEIHQSSAGWSPVYVSEGLGVMSIGFLLPDPDDAVIWRGPRKSGLIKQFLRDVDWGALDVLVVDSPPGTSDEHISLVQLLKSAGRFAQGEGGQAAGMDGGNDANDGASAGGASADGASAGGASAGGASAGGSSAGAPRLVPGLLRDGAVIVSTPQEVACADVRKEVSFCRKTDVAVLGIVQNMAGLRATAGASAWRDAEGADVSERVRAALRAAGLDPDAVATTLEVFPPTPGAGGVEDLARRAGAPLLGTLPLDPSLGAACERGESVLEAGGRGADAIRTVVEGVLRALGEEAKAQPQGERMDL